MKKIHASVIAGLFFEGAFAPSQADAPLASASQAAVATEAKPTPSK